VPTLAGWTLGTSQARLCVSRRYSGHPTLCENPGWLRKVGTTLLCAEV